VPLKVAAAEAMTGRRQSQCLGGKRILVLDERATNREIMLAYLKDAGACPTGVAHSDDALMLLRAAAREGEPFEAAVIDMVMPAASALEVGRRIKADPAIAETRLVMVTSLSWKGDANMVREGGFEAQLSKPVRGVELVGTIGRVIAAVAPMPAASKADPPAAPVSRRRLGARVLLAEDNPVNLEVAREFLANLGCSVSVAVNGMEAVRLHASQPFDLVLMDCQMPEMDGLTATRRIRLHEEARRLPSTPIIAVTANAFEEDRIACLAAGMDDYIRKPFVEETLEAAMLRWFDPRSTNTAVPAAAAAEPAAGVAAPPLAAPAAVLDEVMINRLRAAHRPLLGRLIETYLSYAPKAVAQLSALLLAADAKGLKTSAHSLKSSSANVGALALSAHCRELEGIAKAEAMPLDPRCEGLVRAIEAEFARVVAALEALRAELAVEPAAAASR
jgi:CheY-like chemotaxis protein